MDKPLAEDVQASAIGAEPYDMKGLQIEPGAGYWTWNGFRIRVVDVDSAALSLEPYSTHPDTLELEIRELEALAALRDDDTGQLLKGSLENPDRPRKPLSRFFYLSPPPLAVIFNVKRDQQRRTNVFTQCEEGEAPIATGRELARLFEDETPGLWHRHALNCLLFGRGVSPPRQARIWMALDVTIYSALLAAWHFKWARTTKTGAPDYSISFRERPIVWEQRRAAEAKAGPRFRPLYDLRVNEEGTGEGPPLCDPNLGVVSPGTPRHPAYPSGHSTYSAAASELLTYFFPEARTELNNLADNIGMARLWAGVHWRQDHTAGDLLGRQVAKLVIAQLQDDPVRRLTAGKPQPCNLTPAPAFNEVRDQALAERKKKDPLQDVIPRPQGGPEEYHGANMAGQPL